MKLEMRSIRRLFACGALCALLFPGLGLAQAPAWPTKPIKIVIGYPPGGSTDVAGRLLAEQMSTILGQQVLVENRAGASGRIGALSVVRAEPDGYTLSLSASPEVSIAPVTVKEMPYDPLKDLQPIALVGRVPFLLVTSTAFPPSSVAELISYAKKYPNKVNYASFGANTSNHLVGELFKVRAGIQTTHVPYKGSSPAIIDLMGGQVQYTFDTPPATLTQVRAGKMKALAVATLERLPSAPEVPTLAESGLPDFTGGTWFGLLAPANTPRPIIDRINAAVVAALAAANLRKAFDGRGISPGGGSPEEFGRFIASEITKWRQLAATVGIKPE